MWSEWKADLGNEKVNLHAREARLIKRTARLAVAGTTAAAEVATAENQVLGCGIGG